MAFGLEPEAATGQATSSKGRSSRQHKKTRRAKFSSEFGCCVFGVWPTVQQLMFSGWFLETGEIQDLKKQQAANRLSVTQHRLPQFLERDCRFAQN